MHGIADSLHGSSFLHAYVQYVIKFVRIIGIVMNSSFLSLSGSV